MTLPRVDFSDGARELRDVGRRLARLDLSRPLLDAIERGADIAVRAARAEPEKRLPASGGLAGRVARTRMDVATRAGRNPSVRIIARPNAVKDPRAIDRGRLMKPTFGRAPWKLQRVRPGWFTDPMRASAPAVRREIEREVGDEIRRFRR